MLDVRRLEGLLRTALEDPRFDVARSCAGRALPKEPSALHPGPAEQLELQELWSTKHSARSLGELLGNEGAVRRLSQWLRDWDCKDGRMDKVVSDQTVAATTIVIEKKCSAKACVLSGPPGSGKATAAKLAARENAYEVFDVSASDRRCAKILEQLVAQAVANETILFYTKEGSVKEKKKVVIIKDIVGSEDKAVVQALVHNIRGNKVPVICICQDVRQNNLHPLLEGNLLLELSRYFFSFSLSFPSHYLP